MRLLLVSVLSMLAACARAAPSAPATCTDEPAAAVTNVIVERQPAPPEPHAPRCSLVSTLSIAFPANTPMTFMITPEAEPIERRIPDDATDIEQTSARARIAAAISSVIESERPSAVEMTPRGDGSYRVRVRTQIDRFATCHGRYDELDLSGVAKIDGTAVDITLEGADNVSEDICSPDGRTRNLMARRRAKATLHVERQCEGSIAGAQR